jgi:hypothetical protein
VATLAIAALVTAIGVAAGPLAASADTGERSINTTCGGNGTWTSPISGTPHAQITNCSIKWSKNIYTSEYWQRVTFTLQDRLTDGVCARATVTGSSRVLSECNAVATPATVDLSGRHTSLTIVLSWGGNQPVGRQQPAPSGF